MRGVALALVAASCASQKSAESHSDYTGKVDTVRTEGAERVTTVVREYAPPEEVMPSATADERRSLRQSDDVGLSVTRGVAVEADHGPLIKETTTTTETGPITTTTKASADAHADAESASKWHLGPGVLGWMACAAGAVLALLLAWKFRSGLLGSALKLIGKG